MSNVDYYSIALESIAKEAQEKTGVLCLSALGLKKIPPEIWELSHLHELHLSSPRYSPNICRFLADEWSRISEFRELRTLFLDGLTIPDLTPLAGLRSLQRITCSRTQVSDLTPLAGLTSLSELICSGTQVSDLTPIAGLSSLQKLDCHSIRVPNLTPLAGLSSLQKLDCSGTDVSDLAPLAGLNSLQELNCSRMYVSDLAPLAGLSSLQDLKFYDTWVTDLAPLGGLSALQVLWFGNLWIAEQVSDLAPLAGLISLQELSFVDAKVTDLTPLAGLSALKSLNFNRTPASDLTPLAGLTSLSELICSCTQVSDLTPLAGLSSLLRLKCNDTQVSDLTPLAGLCSIASVDCSKTKISTIPQELLCKNSLYFFGLSGCSIEGVPSELLQDNCLEGLRAHYKDLEIGKSPLPDVKIIILGNGLIGKTQICRRLRGEEYDETVDSTHGITVTGTALNRDASSWLHLWDFGGQEIYHGTHALFMRTRAIFLVVWTPESENQSEHEHRGLTFRNHRLDYWLEMVEQFGGDHSPVLLVQTRCDSHEDELRIPPADEDLLNRPAYLRLLQYSARNDRKRATLDEELRDAIQWMRDRQGQTVIGSGRLRVKDRLEALRNADALLPVEKRLHRTLTKDAFLEMCEQEGGVSCPDALLNYLHECGLLFYKNGLFLDKIILDQAWVLDAVYALFHREKCWKKLRHLKGRFTRSLLELLAWEKYSEDEQNLFISFMKSCSICFTHNNTYSNEETEYIAPDFLPGKKEVTDELSALWPDTEDVLEQVIPYPFENPSLLRSIISEVGHKAGTHALYWKDGVCGYDKHTRSRLLMEALPPAVKGDYGFRLRIQTQGGSKSQLLSNILPSIQRTFENNGCRTWPENLKSISETDNANPSVPIEFSAPPDEADQTTYGVSYAWNDESSRIVDELCVDAKTRGITIMRDKDSLQFGERISKFMKKLAQNDRIFVILSKKYLESPNCMFELFEIWRNCRQEDEEFLKRIRIFALSDAEFRTAVDRAKQAIYWKKRFNELDELIKTHGADILGAEDFKSYKLMKDFSHHVSDILHLVSDTLSPSKLKDLESFSFE